MTQKDGVIERVIMCRYYLAECELCGAFLTYAVCTVCFIA